MAASSIVAALAVVPLLPLILVLLIRLSLRGLGWFLQARSRDRRAAIIAKVRRDRDAISARLQSAHHGTEDGWEKIEKAGTAENGGPMHNDWEGIVGFFHPFW
jgi:alpha-1,2-mannosyltransferase